MVIMIEFFGAFALIFGFATRIVSVGVISLFTGIVFTSHFQNGFFMNWSGQMQGEGFEYHLLVVGIAIALLINGSGRWAVDRVLMKRN
jgi:putative oxidoreductase